MKKETGLMFKAPLVRAILSGQKTQTRRAAKDVKHPCWGNIYTPGALAREPQHTIDAASKNSGNPPAANGQQTLGSGSSTSSALSAQQAIGGK